MIVTDADAVRVELFKLNYMRGEFVLNDKADAQECLVFVLTQIHTWMQMCTTPPDKESNRVMYSKAEADTTIKLEKLARTVKCQF